MFQKFIFFLLTVLFLFLPNSPAEAQYERNRYIPVNSIDYDIYMYPTTNELFSLPNSFELKFSISNGKYFYLMFEDSLGKRDTNIDIYFYTEDGALLAKQNVRKINTSYIIPQNETSINSDNLKVRIVNYDKVQRNFKLIIAKSKTSYRGTKVREGEDFTHYNNKCEGNSSEK